jgi:hypothetical protein
VTIQEFGAIGEIVGGVGVIASLLYLAVQIRQSSLISRTATTQALLGHSIQMNATASGDISPVIAKLRNSQTLNEEEQHQYFSYMMAVFAQSWQAHFQHSHGMLEQEVYEAYERRTLSFLESPAALEFWRDNAFRFSQSFRDYVASLIERAD